MAYFPNTIQFGDNGAIDANSRLRVVNPETIFASNFIYSTASYEWSLRTGSVGSSISHLPNESGVLLTIGTGSGDECTYQTKAYTLPMTGKAYNFIHTFLFGAPITNVSRSIGFFDDNNGYYLEQSGNGNINIVQRLKTSGTVVNNVISQSAWNIDKMDGTGVSGKNLDFTKIQAFSLDSFWPAGRVRCGFRIDGMRYNAHSFYCSNVMTTPNVSSPQIPLRARIYSTGVSSGTTMKLYHSSGRIEGGVQERGRHFSTGSNGTITVTTRRPIISIRPKQIYKGIVNRGQALLKNLSLYTETNSCFWELVYGGILSGDSWKDVHTNSMMEVDFSATTISNGEIVECGYNSAVSGPNGLKTSLDFLLIEEKRPICLNDVSGSDNSGIVVSIVCTSISGNSLNAGSLTWTEFK